PQRAIPSASTLPPTSLFLHYSIVKEQAPDRPGTENSSSAEITFGLDFPSDAYAALSGYHRGASGTSFHSPAACRLRWWGVYSCGLGMVSTPLSKLFPDIRVASGETRLA